MSEMTSAKRRTRVDARVGDITHSGGLDHVAHGEALDRLVLGHAARAVRAADEVDMATTLLVTATGASLLGLWGT
jgi:hypothetical protein